MVESCLPSKFPDKNCNGVDDWRVSCRLQGWKAAWGGKLSPPHPAGFGDLPCAPADSLLGFFQSMNPHLHSLEMSWLPTVPIEARAFRIEKTPISRLEVESNGKVIEKW